MRRQSTLAAAFLAVGFGFVSYVMLAVEPGMGFNTPADILDATKVAAGLGTTVWFVENILYFALSLALAALAVSSDDRYMNWSGLLAALLFLVIASFDRVGIQLRSMLASDDQVVAAVATVLPARLALLKAMVFVLGVFAWRTTQALPAQGTARWLWSATGWVVLAASVLFLFVFVPVPVLFCLWGAALTFRTLGVREGVEAAVPA